MATQKEQFAAAEALARAGKLDEALRAYSKILKRAPGNTQARYRVAVVELMRGRIQDGEKHLRICLRNQPENPDILFSLGRARAARGAYEEAAEHLATAAVLAPERADIKSVLGDAYYLSGDLTEALTVYTAASQQSPADPRIKVNMANVYSRLGDHDNAIRTMQAAVDLMPDSPEIALALATVLRSAGQLAEAYRIADTIVSGAPENISAVALKAELLDRLGDNNEAAALLIPHLDTDPVPPALARACGQVAINQVQEGISRADVISLIDRALTRPGLNRLERRGLLFMQAALQQKTGDHKAAFATARQANTEAGIHYDRDAVNRRFDRYRNTFALERLPRLSLSTVQDETPVFILGMPRSGTSLVEQILDSHPEIAGGGELPGIPRATQTLPDYPDTLESLDGGALDTIAQTYLAELREISADARFVTDKMPINAEHLGFIWQLFPNARVIHCRRHPLAIGLSCFFQNFRSRNEFTFSLEGFAHYYRHYDSLMAHWQRTLNLPTLELHYERLTTDPRETIAEMLSFLDLPWDDACLAFDKNKRFVDTLSYAQVRRPISHEASARHLKYATQLAPLADALADEIARYESEAPTTG